MFNTDLAPGTIGHNYILNFLHIRELDEIGNDRG